MRRLACLSATALLLCGCHYASSPLVGFGGFIGDTHVFNGNPNLPPGSAETMRRVEGQQVSAEPLQPEPGNIWPGQPTAEPTLEDVIRTEQPDQGPPGQGSVPPASSAHPQPRPNGSGSTPPSVQLQSQPSPRDEPPPPAPIRVPPSTVPTQGGPQVLNRGGNGITTTTAPGGGTSIIVPNGNGTSTIIGPDGSTQTVPTPR